MPDSRPQPDDAENRARRAHATALIDATLRRLGLDAPRGLDRRTRALAVTVFGMVGGTLLDASHIYTGTAAYLNVARIPWLDVAWYVPLEFALAGLAVGMIRPELDEHLNRERTETLAWQLIVGLVFMVVVWAGSGVLTNLEVANDRIAMLLTALAVGAWAVLDRTWQGMVAGLITVALGVAAEASLSLTGTYRYTHPDVIGVPWWLPSLYLMACIAVGNVGRFLKYSRVPTGWDPPGPPPSSPAR